MICVVHITPSHFGTKHVTTDFSGKAKFNAVPYGTYYLFGIGTTPKAFAVWNVKVDVTSAETLVTLDQNNSLFAF
jgi:hypothetical protein